MGVNGLPLLELCVRRAGAVNGRDPAGFRDLHQGRRVSQYVLQWAITAQDLGHFPTTVEYAEWWAISERQAWRRRAAIHDLFEGDLMREVVEDVASSLDSRKSLRDQMQVRVRAAAA